MTGFKQWHRGAVLALQDYYWAPGGPAGATRDELAASIRGGWKVALADYYGRFAYERAGAGPTWAPCARELLLDYPGDLPGRDLPAWAWSQLQLRLGRTDGLNPHNNGLYPHQPGRPPMTAFVRTLVEDRHNIFGWAARLLSDGRAAEASRSLLGVHGVGSKIAAFLLRDVLVAVRIPEDQIGGAHLIQPVDIWVRRAAVDLAQDDTLASEGRDPVTARRMVKLAAELGVPGAALNCALWVLGARLARSEVALKSALTDRGAFVGLVAAEISRAAHNLEALREWLEPLVEDPPSDV